MSSVVIAGDTSGTITLAAPAVAGSTTLTLQANTGNIPVVTGTGTSGQVLTSGGSGAVSTWSTISAGATTLKIVTDSTDIALTVVAPTYSTIGSTFSVSIPTTGLIRLSSFVGRINNTTNAQGGGPTFGIRIGSTNYWLSLLSDNGTDKYYLGVGELNASAYMTSNGSLGNTANSTYSRPQCLDIAYNSVPTGTQTVQLICAKNNTAYSDNITIKGTTITTKVGIEFVSAS